MPVIFHEDSRIFHLTNDYVSYLIRIMENDQPEHLYYGKKLRDSDGEVKRLRQQSADVTVIYRQLQEAREKLMRREKELMEERQRAEAERQRHAADEQTLLARLSSLEMGMPGATHQSREARTVRLAPWMGLKK